MPDAYNARLLVRWSEPKPDVLFAKSLKSNRIAAIVTHSRASYTLYYGHEQTSDDWNIAGNVWISCLKTAKHHASVWLKNGVTPTTE